MMLLSKQGELLKKPGAKLPVFLFQFFIHNTTFFISNSDSWFFFLSLTKFLILTFANKPLL